MNNIKIVGANLSDVPKIQKLLKNEIEKGVILYRSDDEIAMNIRSYLIAKDENNCDEIIGCVALHIYSMGLAEFRSMMVNQKYRMQGVGSLLIAKGIEDAKNLGLKEILVLTYKSYFFSKFGFREIPKIEIPDNKIWADCIKCSQFPVCEEVALIKKI